MPALCSAPASAMLYKWTQDASCHIFVYMQAFIRLPGSVEDWQRLDEDPVSVQSECFCVGGIDWCAACSVPSLSVPGCVDYRRQMHCLANLLYAVSSLTSNTDGRQSSTTVSVTCWSASKVCLQGYLDTANKPSGLGRVSESFEHCKLTCVCAAACSLSTQAGASAGHSTVSHQRCDARELLPVIDTCD